MNKSSLEFVDHNFNMITGCYGNCTNCHVSKRIKAFSGDIRANMSKVTEYQKITLDDEKNLYELTKPMKAENGKIINYPFGFLPTLHWYRIMTLNVPKSSMVFAVGTMGDIFEKWIPDEWIEGMMKAIKANPQHTYVFCTRNPERYQQVLYNFPTLKRSNKWFGVKLENTDDWRKTQFLPDDYHTFLYFNNLSEFMFSQPHWDKFHLRKGKPEWIIIGSDKGKGTKHIEKDWIDDIASEAYSRQIPVFMRDSLKTLMGKDFVQEYPENYKQKIIGKKLRGKLYTTCNLCGAYRKKADMIKLHASLYRGVSHKQFAYLCPDCFRRLCRKLGVQEPVFKKKGEHNEEENL